MRATWRFAVGLLVLVLVPGLPWLAGAAGFNHRHVLIVGIDGCRPDALLAADAPHLQGLAATGAVTWHAYAGGVPGSVTEQATLSGPGWASILTGVWADQHGVVDNTFSGYRATAYPHFFRRLKEHQPEAYLASLVEWRAIDTHLVEPIAAWTDFRQTAQDGATYDLVMRTVAHLATADPDVVFVHFDAVDLAGHSFGFGPNAWFYLRAIEQVDAGIGAILEAVRQRPQYANEQWLVIVVTDHGGQGFGHGGQTPAERTIFVIVSGGDVRPQTISPGPGQTCIPATVLAHLGVPIRTAWGWEAPPFGVPQTSLLSGLRVYLGFDGTVAAQGPTGRDGIAVFGAPGYTEGRLGQAARFRNEGGAGTPSDWAVSLGDLNEVYAGSFTVACWSRTGSSAAAALAGNMDLAVAGPGWAITTDPLASLQWRTGDGVPQRMVLPADFRDGDWHLVTASFDREHARVAAYLDGRAIGSGSVATAPAAFLTTGFATLVGASGPGSLAGHADVDEFALWDRVLSGFEVQELHAKAGLGKTLIQTDATPRMFLHHEPAGMVLEWGPPGWRVEAAEALGAGEQWTILPATYRFTFELQPGAARYFRVVRP